MSASDERITVLVVESDPAVATVYASYLADEFDVRTVASVERAVHQLDDVDVVVVGTPAPGHHEDEVVTELRGLGIDGPIAVLSGMQPVQPADTPQHEGGLATPVGRDVLAETVRRMADRARARPSACPDGQERQGGSWRGSGSAAAMLDSRAGTAVRSTTRELAAGAAQTLLAEIADHSLPPVIAELVEEYQSVEDARPLFMWKWVHRLAPQNTLPIVDVPYRSSVPIDKTLTILFITLLDDRMEKRGDRATFVELAKLPDPVQRPDLSAPEVDSEYVRFASRVWRTLLERLERAPRFDTYEGLFRFDVSQAVTAIEYSHLAIQDPAVATMGDLERTESHNMAMLAYADIDLMYASADRRGDLATIREAVWIAQHMARIGNWVSTWERELREGDWSAGPIVYAVEDGVVSRAELLASRDGEDVQDELVERIHDHGIEQTFFERWERHLEDLRELDRSHASLDLRQFIEGTREVLRYHLASRGLK